MVTPALVFAQCPEGRHGPQSEDCVELLHNGGCCWPREDHGIDNSTLAQKPSLHWSRVCVFLLDLDERLRRVDPDETRDLHTKMAHKEGRIERSWHDGPFTETGRNLMEEEIFVGGGSHSCWEGDASQSRTVSDSFCEAVCGSDAMRTTHGNLGTERPCRVHKSVVFHV